MLPLGSLIMSTPWAAIAVALLSLIAVFQLALALGAPWGRFAWGGQHDRELPARLRVSSAFSIVLYAAFALVLLDRAGAVDLLPGSWSRVGTWVLLAFLSLGVVMNAASRSRHERAVMTPIALSLAVCTLLVALS